MSEVFPYLSAQNIRTAISHLIRDGYLIKDNLNDYAWQHTNWYALTERGLRTFNLLGNQQIDLLNQQNDCIDSTEQKNNRINNKKDNNRNTFIDINRQDDSIIDDSLKPTKAKKFIKPTIEEVAGYCHERGNNIVPEEFFDFYESKGWMVGKNHMKDWRAAVRTWERDRANKRTASGKPEKESLPDYYRKLYKQLGINPDGTPIGGTAQQSAPQYGKQPYDFAADFGIDEQ